jgi:hypothetical protein
MCRRAVLGIGLYLVLPLAFGITPLFPNSPEGRGLRF